MNEIRKDVYLECVRMAKGYYDLIEQRRQIEKEILYGSAGPSDGMPHAGPGNPTAAKAERLIRAKAMADKKIRALQNALEHLPDDWCAKLIRNNLFRRPPISMECLLYRHGYPMSIRTMKRVRHDYIMDVAREMDWK